MAEKVFLRFLPQTHQVCWLALSSLGRIPLTPEYGSLADAAKEVQNKSVVALVPGNKVYLTAVNIPTRNRMRLLQAIPYALEEQLAEDVHDLHFAVGDRLEDGRVPVAVVNKLQMQQWAMDLKQAGIQVTQMIPDILCIPQHNGDWGVVLEGDKALFRTDTHGGFVLEADTIKTVLPLVLKTYPTLPEKLEVADCGVGLNPIPGLWGQEVPTMTVKYHEESAFSYLARNYDSGKAINLLQGEFSKKEQLGKYWRPWRPAMNMLIIYLILQVTVTLGEFISLKGQTSALWLQMGKSYTDTFPGKKPVDPRNQMEQELKRLQGGLPSGESLGFIQLLGAIGNDISQSSEIKLERLNYKEGKLVLEMTVPDLQQLDKFVQLLKSKNTLQVEVMAANSKENKVEARLKVQGVMK